MSTLSKLLSVFASEVSLFEAAAAAIKAEIIPSTVTDMITEWEAALDIPTSSDAIATRRARVIAKLRAVGGQSEDYFYSIAESLGYNISPSTTDPHIEISTDNYPAFKAGLSHAGDPVYSGGSGASMFTWRVSGTSVETDAFLQEILNKYKPAHTEIEFVNA